MGLVDQKNIVMQNALAGYGIEITLKKVRWLLKANDLKKI